MKMKMEHDEIEMFVAEDEEIVVTGGSGLWKVESSKGYGVLIVPIGERSDFYLIHDEPSDVEWMFSQTVDSDDMAIQLALANVGDYLKE